MATKTDTDKLVESLGGMTVLELVELKNKLEEEWGVTAAAPMAVAAAPAAGGDGRPRRFTPSVRSFSRSAHRVTSAGGLSVWAANPPVEPYPPAPRSDPGRIATS